MQSGAPASSRPRTEPLSAVEVATAALARGDYPGAVRAAFPLVVQDVEEAFGRPFPRHWTDRDIIVHGLRPDSGNLPSLMLDLYLLYEPVRYGDPREPGSGDLAGALQRLYTDSVLARWKASNPPGSRAFSVGRRATVQVYPTEGAKSQ